MIKITDLCCSGLRTPMGISISSPYLGWILESDERGIRQNSYRVRVFAEKSGELQLFYDSGIVSGNVSGYSLRDLDFSSGCRYHWNVEVTCSDGRSLPSEMSWFETGLLHPSDWTASWILPEREKVAEDVRTYMGYDEPKMSHEIDEDSLLPCPLIRQNFSLKKKVKKARAYATAHGIYRLFLNGQRAGDLEFAPEVTPYDKCLQVQTYDVTELLTEGPNVLGIALAEGWWAGRIGHYGESIQYGDQLAALVQINVEYEDGTCETIGTGADAKSGTGARRYGELYIGEKYDAGKKQADWSEAAFAEDSDWRPVQVAEYGYKELIGQNADPIRILRRRSAERIYRSPKGEMIIDFGQLMAGNATMHLSGEPDAAVKLEYFETTDAEGNYWFELDGRNSQQTDTVILGNDGHADYDPWFTYHGYRYIRISADRGTVTPTAVEGRLIASDVDVTLQIETSNPLLNRLHKNIEWTLLSNMTSILTDNPERERAGWTGDLQMVFPTLSYHTRADAFVTRWLSEARLEQFDNGLIPMVIPFWKIYRNMPVITSAGWGDAMTIVPWLLYEKYGDKTVLRDNYEAMKKWVRYETDKARVLTAEAEKLPEAEKEAEQNLWNADFNYGDWLTPSACYDPETDTYTYYTQTLCYLMGPYYHAYSTRIMEKTAAVLGYEKDRQEYAALYDRIRASVIERIYKKGGILESDLMGAQILALHMGFYPEGEKNALIKRILELIGQRGMDCGFSSVLEIFDLLCENGYTEKAYDILLNEKFPSWLYEVKQGATSVWESMQAIMPDGKRNAVSYIQPAFCSVGSWMVQGMGGIRPLKPGFEEILIHPQFTERLNYADVSYQSVRGKIRCRWEKADKTVRISVSIPANCTAKLILPGASEETVQESGKPLDRSQGVICKKTTPEGIMVEILSGDYDFTYRHR